METKYATLRRPKRKLCYLTSNERASKQWAGALSLGDIDKMFDDLEPSSHEDDDLIPPSSLLQNSDSDTNQSEREAPLISQPERQLTGEKPPVRLMGPDGDVLHPATRSLSPELDIDFPFKAHRPVKTSSPIEKNVVVEGVEELDNEKNGVVSPILFPCEDEGEEAAKTDPLPIQKPHCNKHITEQSDDSELESPPSKIALSKLKMSSHKNKVAGSCSENTDALVSAVRQEPEVAIHKKKSKNVLRQPSMEVSRVGKDMTTFLQKLRDAAQPKPACSRKSLSPVKVPAPPEPEDDFLILEDDTPLWFSIPRKTATSKKQGQSRTSSTDKDSSADKGAKNSPLKTTQKQQESDQANGKLGSQTVSQKIKKMKGKEKMNEVTEPGNDMNELCSPEDLSAGDLVEQEKPSKKTRLKKVASKHSDKAEEQPKESASRETDKEEPPLKMEKKAQKSLKDGNENGQTRRAKSSKGARKDTQGSGAVKEPVHVEAVKRQSEEHASAEDLCSLSEIMNSEAEMDEKDNQNQLPAVSEESSSEDGQIVRKRKRRQPGQWWLSCSQETEETKATNKQPTPKKSKQNKKEPSAAVLSRVKTKKDRVLKKINPTQPAPSSSQTTKQANEKQTKRNKNRSTRGETPEKQQQKEQEQDLDLDPVHCSPLVLPHRDHSLNSGDQVFQRVYRHASNEKLSITPVPQGREQLRAEEPEKRRRNPPSNWWMVNGTTEDMKSISSQHGQQEPKPRKERKKQFKQSRSPGLGTPKNGNMVVSSKPPEGAPVTPLKVKPLLAPKSVKRSLATFKDIFTSAIETPIVTSSREAGQNNRHKVTECPAVEVTVTDCTTTGKTDEDILSMDAGESNSPPNREDPQDSKCQPESMSKAHRSGPSSMIVLEQYEENEDLNVPSTRVSAVLSASDLCGPPLKPLILQPKDKANLTEWFKSLWSTTVDNGHEITPDQFDWYFYQGRAIGFLVDLNCGSICNGKILLGSYMKKPLWVDHSATTVFNLLTSSVSVIVNGCESRFSPGQSFMVPCGHAYSIQNVTAQPAVVYFTRIVAESSD